MPDWSFEPLEPVVERLEFRTDVIRADADEQRIALRTVPREILRLRHRLTSSQIAEAQRLAEAEYRAIWTVPLWHRVAGQTPGTRTGRLTEGVGFRRQRSRFAEASVAFTLDPDPSPPAAPAYPQIDNSDVLTRPTVVRRPLSESAGLSTVVVDNGFGPLAFEALRETVERTAEIQLHAYGESARDDLRGWLYALRGRQRSFWLPSWGNDYPAAAAATAGATALTVATDAAASDLDGLSVLIETATPQARTVTAASDVAGGVEITVAALSADVAAGTRVHRLYRVRLDSDDVELRHTARSTVATAPVREVAS